MRENNLAQLDRDHLIHPVTSWAEHERSGPIILERGEGSTLIDAGGHRLLDGFAGLWCVNAGYGQSSVIAAATAQMEALPYATGYFHFASAPTIQLAARLAELTPEGLDHTYFTLGGSDAIDSAIKFIRYYWSARGEPERRHFISLDKGYHGSTTSGSRVTGLPLFHTGFGLAADEQHYLPAPYPYRHRTGADADVIADSVAALRAKVEAVGPEKVAAFFCEPIQGSGGVVVPPRGWLKAMETTCRELGILLVVDEVITGFGRTGPMFACESEGVSPDLMTLAKGLTSGYAPMGAVVLSDQVYRAIADLAPEGAAIGHGFTYSGHPVSAAVGLEVIRLYTEGGILANGQKVAGQFMETLTRFADHPLVGDVRGRGLLAALELVADKASKQKHAPQVGIPGHLARIGFENGLLFRAFADNIIGFAPPLVMTPEDIDALGEKLGATLDALLEIKEVRDATA